MYSSLTGGGFAALSTEQFTTIDEYGESLAQVKGDIAGIVLINEGARTTTVSFQSEETGKTLGAIRVDFDRHILDEAETTSDLPEFDLAAVEEHLLADAA